MGRAVGVEVREKGKIGMPKTVRAKKMVVVSACAFGTTLLLERPGIMIRWCCRRRVKAVGTS
jgi:hypothetical protein